MFQLAVSLTACLLYHIQKTLSTTFFIVFCLSFYDCLPFLAVSLFILSSEHIIVNMFFNFFIYYFRSLFMCSGSAKIPSYI